ncbi:hypothetical protein ACFYO5_11360 [Streptomyces sp. NPDC006259]|uniref:hypothetical protein n=1 Tax=Streptomyces sp. NPDC006259 TaxID=3364740 RepID=UPI0036AD8BEE
MFTARRLVAPWALYPSTTDPDTVPEWLTWASVGMGRMVFKRLDDADRPSVRGWEKYKVRERSGAGGRPDRRAAHARCHKLR